MSLRQLKRQFADRLTSIEKAAIRDLAQLTHHVTSFNGEITEKESSQVQHMVESRTQKLVNVKILRDLLISFN